jgi:putative membrane protein
VTRWLRDNSLSLAFLLLFLGALVGSLSRPYGGPGLAVLYLVAVGPLRRKYGWADGIERSRVAWFMTGVAVMFLALNGPIHDLGDNYLFSAHMIQHLMITLIMPPLLLAGTPAWLYRPLLRHGWIWRTARALTAPLAAFAIYNVVLSVWHLPRFYNWALVDHNVHVVQHLMFMAAAVLVWWPAVNPVPELTRLQPPIRLLYLFALGIPMSMISALITLSSDVLYEWYAAAPRVFENLSALDDQQLGGLIMWIPAMKIYWIAITILFFRWSRQDLKESAGEGGGRGAPEAAMVLAGGSRE